MSGENGNGNGLQVPEIIPGGLGERCLWTAGARDVRLAERATRECWVMSDAARAAMMARLEAVVLDPGSKPRAFFSAVKAIAGLQRITLAAVDCAIRAHQFEDLAERVAELEKRQARNRLNDRLGGRRR